MDFVAAMDQIVELDKVGKAEETLSLIREMLAYPYGVPQILFAGIVYSLATTKMLTKTGEVKAKWEIYQTDLGSEDSRSWSEFCEEHLKTSPSTASVCKRVWEVFIVELGYEPMDFAQASLGDLANVVGSVAGLPLQEQVQLVDRVIEKPGRRGKYVFGKENVKEELLRELGRDAVTCRDSGHSRKSRKPMPVSGFVYLISDPEFGFKIGRTADLDGRVRTLSRSYGARMEIVCSKWFENCLEAERRLHRRFGNKRKGGEWFDLDEGDIQFIQDYMT